MTRRVIQFSTGNVGIHALRTIIGAPRPGTRRGSMRAARTRSGATRPTCVVLRKATGVVATDDIDALVALGADCVVYTSQAETRPKEALGEIARFLRPARMSLVPRLFGWWHQTRPTAGCGEPLAKACADGDATLYINGIDRVSPATPWSTPR